MDEKRLKAPVHRTDTDFFYNMLSYRRRETALQGALVLAKSRRLEMGNTILWTL